MIFAVSISENEKGRKKEEEEKENVAFGIRSPFMSEDENLQN